MRGKMEKKFYVPAVRGSTRNKGTGSLRFKTCDQAGNHAQSDRVGPRYLKGAFGYDRMR